MPPRKKRTNIVSPGTLKDDEDVSSGTLIVTEGDKEYRVHTEDVGAADSLACRQQTGLPVEQFLTSFGSDTMLAVIWLARRHNGEPNLSFWSVSEKYGTRKALNKLALDMEYDDPDEKPDPKADEGS